MGGVVSYARCVILFAYAPKSGQETSFSFTRRYSIYYSGISYEVQSVVLSYGVQDYRYTAVDRITKYYFLLNRSHDHTAVCVFVVMLASVATG